MRRRRRRLCYIAFKCTVGGHDIFTRIIVFLYFCDCLEIDNRNPVTPLYAQHTSLVTILFNCLMGLGYRQSS